MAEIGVKMAYLEIGHPQGLCQKSQNGAVTLHQRRTSFSHTPCMTG